MKKRVFCILLFVLCMGTLLPNQAAVLEPMKPFAEEQRKNTSLRSFGKDILPGRWFAGDYGKKPVVRSQGKYGTCWALTAASAMEAALLPEQHLVFSADHMSLNNAFSADVNVGGDYIMTMAYLSGWQGPVTEEEDPYGDAYSPEGLTPAVHVQEIQVMQDADVQQIKEAVYHYGAVQTSLYMSRGTTSVQKNYYNPMHAAYYYPDQKTQNHDVLILGWDDSFSRFRFLQIPEQDGAFICQNSWGESFGKQGIFYVSYSDANIGSINLVYSGIEEADNYDKIYQTDDCGWQGNQGYEDGMCWFANIYTAEEKEDLEAVGFYATAPDTDYVIYLVHDASDSAEFFRREKIAEGNIAEMGYYTIPLQPQEISAGERFAIVVQITTKNRVNPVAVEYDSGAYTENVTLEGKEGYLSRDGEHWQNTEKGFGTNVCLKAYTVFDR